MTNSIPKQVLQGLKQVVVETGEQAAKEAVKAVDSVISGKDLVGDAKEINKKHEEELKRNDQEELAKLRQGIGRNVEVEIKQVRDEKKREEEEKERVFLENLRRQREAEQAEMAAAMSVESANPAKRKKKRGSAFAKGGKSRPSQSDMSATGEFKGKVD